MSDAFLYLFDGTYELFRAFYGAPSNISAARQQVGATKALLRTWARFLRQSSASVADTLPDKTPLYVAAAFDHEIESFRNELFDGYKTGEGIDPDLKAQFASAEQAAKALGMTVWPMVEFEADDALASAAIQFADHAQLKQIRICTPDKDLAQVVRGDRIVMYDFRTEHAMTESEVISKWGVPPQSIADYLALVGDSADGVPGVPSWGAKSTAMLLQAYGQIESIPDDESTWVTRPRGAARLAQHLREHREQAKLYKRLTTLRMDVPLSMELDELRWRGANRQLLKQLCDSISDTRFMSWAEQNLPLR